MPRFKRPDYGLKMIPVDFDRQVMPGSFEHALCHLVDHEIDLARLEARYRNDSTGPPPSPRPCCSRSCCSATRAAW